MARQNVNYDPSQKLFEAYMDFSGGINSEIANERLRDNEFPVLENVDLSRRGSAKRRTGRDLIHSIEGTAQGMWYFYRTNQTEPDLIEAVSGNLYVKPSGSSTATQISITQNGTPGFTFQDTLPIQAEQYNDVMFIATGTSLVELSYDGSWVAKTVEPYAPSAMEAIYIGTNGLMSDPDGYLQNTTGPKLKVNGMKPSVYKGVVNEYITWQAFVEKPETSTEVQYKWEYKKESETEYTLGVDYNDSDSWEFQPDTIMNYQVRVTVRDKQYIDIVDMPWNSVSGTIGISISGDTVDKVVGTQSMKIVSDGSTVKGTYIAEKTISPISISGKDSIRFWIKVDTQIYYENFNLMLFDESGQYIYTPSLGTHLDAPNGLNDWVQVTMFMPGSELDRPETVVHSAKIVYYGLGVNNASNGPFTLWLDGIEVVKADAGLKWTFPSYPVFDVKQKDADTASVSGIQSCRMVKLHWDRLILSQDSGNTGQLYISDSLNPRYFPIPNTRQVAGDRNEPVTSLVRYKDMLVIFTKTTITAMSGKAPAYTGTSEPYVDRLIHDRMGCIAPRSAQVVGNEIFFLSSDGIHSIRPTSLQLDNLNVKRIDLPIKSEIVPSEDACAMVYDGQYWIAFPNQTTVYRLYYEAGMWVKDKSTKLNISQFIEYVGNVYNLSEDGKLYKHNQEKYSDDNEVYEMKVESKLLDLSSSFNYKRLKRLYVLGKHYQEHHVELYTEVFADSQIVLTPTTGGPIIGEDGYVQWVSTTEPNLHFYSASKFGTWDIGHSLLGDVNISVQKAGVRGKCRRVKVAFTHQQDKPCELFGFGLEFRLNKP